MKKLICVEDDSDISELISYTLTSYGFDVSAVGNAAEFYSELENNVYDMVILDIMLPDEDGIHILKNIRKNPRFKRLPVIMLTAKSGQMDKIKGLDSGADDYITKPFDIMEFISRVKAVLRRSEPDTDNSVIEFSGLTINTASREVFDGTKEIALTFKEFELLSILVSNMNYVQTRDTLMNRVWGTSFGGESRTLDVHIRTLRQKLGDAGRNIETIRNVGYKAVQK